MNIPLSCMYRLWESEEQLMGIRNDGGTVIYTRILEINSVYYLLVVWTSAPEKTE